MSQQNQPAIALDRITRSFSGYSALRDLSLTIPTGATVMIVGANGAGKSTLLRIIAGLLAPSQGAVQLFGKTAAEVRGEVGLMEHATMLYDELTGFENMLYFAQLYAPHATSSALKQVAAAALASVGLDPTLPRRVGQYSQGMRQRAALARVLLAEPKLLLLDEPFSNLDVMSTQAIIQRLRTYTSEPATDGTLRTLLLTTHQHDLGRSLASHVLTLDEGRVTSFEEVAR